MAIELLTPFTKVELEVKEKDKNRKQIGILGGNFNPIHNAHLIVADQVRQQLGLDKVFLMPEYLPPHVDTKSTIDEKHRLEMVKLAIDSAEGLDVETLELERKGVSYTYDTMKLLVEKIQMWITTLSLGLIWLIICLSGIRLMSWLKWFNLLVFKDLSIKQGHLIH